jgi:formate hydrogenlyase subunit 6/NADH:ubiquinone oxidoreductase subunit I
MLGWIARLVKPAKLGTKAAEMAVRNLTQRPITIDYPRTYLFAPAGLRGRPRLNRRRCIACQFCVTHCPTDAIRPFRGKVAIDLIRCIFCGVCEEVCPVDALTHTWDFELATRRKVLRVR